MSELFIPQKIRVGYQEREGTYTGRLSYVIYYDNKGVLRKEKSWQDWRDKKLPPEEFENKPQDGFCLNKDVKRFNWSHFGSDRSYIRMYDPRGIEFEVTPENLIGILTETDCLKRGLEGKFVYAWKGPELILLPCGSEAYTKAKTNTERQDQDISARDLKPGCSYTTKKGEEVIYVGRFPCFEWDKYRKKARIFKKQHIFAHPQKPQWGQTLFPKSDVKFLAVLNSSDPVQNYADLVDEWNKDLRSSSIKEWEFSPETLSEEEVFGTEVDQKTYPYIRRSQFIENKEEVVIFWSIQAQLPYYSKNIQYSMIDLGRLNTDTMVYERSGYDYADRNKETAPKEKIFERVSKSVKAKMVMSNGKKIKVGSIDDIAQ